MPKETENKTQFRNYRCRIGDFDRHTWYFGQQVLENVLKIAILFYLSLD